MTSTVYICVILYNEWAECSKRQPWIITCDSLEFIDSGWGWVETTWLPEWASTLVLLTKLLPQTGHMGRATPTAESLNNFSSAWVQLCDNLPDFFHCSLISQRQWFECLWQRVYLRWAESSALCYVIHTAHYRAALFQLSSYFEGIVFVCLWDKRLHKMVLWIKKKRWLNSRGAWVKH